VLDVLHAFVVAVDPMRACGGHYYIAVEDARLRLGSALCILALSDRVMGSYKNVIDTVSAKLLTGKQQHSAGKRVSFVT
jgi:hypothetical protein